MALGAALGLVSAAAGWRLGEQADPSGAGQSMRHAAPAAGVSGAGSATDSTPPVWSPWTPALAAQAGALRRGDCPSALAGFAERLTQAAQTESPETGALYLVAGLAAHRCGEPAKAESWLRHRSLDGVPGFADWRLLAVARSARRLKQPVLALAAWERLLAEHRTSPARPAAFLEAIETAREAGQLERASRWLDTALAEALPETTRETLATLDWEVRAARGDREGQRAAARRLLIEFPFAAANLQVVEVLRGPQGAVDWSRALSATQLERRAERLLELGVVAGAMGALDAVVEKERDLRWHLLRARALVLDHQTSDAGRTLERVATRLETPAERYEWHWIRAQAASEALTERRGRPLLAAAESLALRTRRRDDWWAVARGSEDPDRREAALRSLFADLSAADQVAAATSALVDLRALVPGDLSGARFLFDQGWRAYQDAEADTAIGHWRRLREIYPESRYSRAAHYWIGRAHDLAGRAEMATRVLQEVAASDTTDFYRKHAVERLGGWVEVGPRAAPPRALWPEDPALRRARQLSDWGLDGLAAEEMDAVVALGALDRQRPAPRREAVLALRGLVLARQGERRKSLEAVREAFPALGSAYQATVPVEALELFYPLDFAPTIQALADAAHLPASLVFGVVHQESAFDPRAVSRSGARGLMQLMPPTAREWARRLGLRYSLGKLTEPEFSVRLGTSYLRQVLGMFDGNLELSLAGYNNGPSRIRRLWRVHDDAGELDEFVEELAPDETRVYVKRILALQDSYRRLHPHLG